MSVNSFTHVHVGKAVLRLKLISFNHMCKVQVHALLIAHGV